VAYPLVKSLKWTLLRRAYDSFQRGSFPSGDRRRAALPHFVRRGGTWLEPYVIFPRLQDENAAGVSAGMPGRRNTRRPSARESGYRGRRPRNGAASSARLRFRVRAVDRLDAVAGSAEPCRSARRRADG
jgi:hypothetical protein